MKEYSDDVLFQLLKKYSVITKHYEEEIAKELEMDSGYDVSKLLLRNAKRTKNLEMYRILYGYDDADENEKQFIDEMFYCKTADDVGTKENDFRFQQACHRFSLSGRK